MPLQFTEAELRPTSRLRFTEIAEAPPAPERGIITGSLLRGIDNMQATLYGAVGLASEALGGVSIDETDLSNWGLSGYLRNVQEAQANPAEVASFRDIEGVGDAFTYAIEGIMENVPMLIPSLVTGGVGAGLLAAGGRRALGYGIGAYAANWAQEAGGIHGDIYERTGQTSPGIAARYGAVAAGFDTAAEMLPIARLGKVFRAGDIKAGAGAIGMGLAKEVTDRLFARVGKAAGIQLLTEGGTEAMQTAIEEAAVSHADPSVPFWTNETIDRIIDAGIKGGITGAALGGLTAIPRPPTPEERPAGVLERPTAIPEGEEIMGEEAETPLLSVEELTRGAAAPSGTVTTTAAVTAPPAGVPGAAPAVAAVAAGAPTTTDQNAVSQATFGGAAPDAVPLAGTTAAITSDPQTAGTVVAAQLEASGAPASAAAVRAMTGIAPQAAPTAPAPGAVVRIDKDSFGPQIGSNMTQFGEAVAQEVRKALATGASVTLISDSGRARIKIVSVDSRGGLVDEKGQPWGSGWMMASKQEGLDIAYPTPSPPPTTEVPSAIQEPRPGRVYGGPSPQTVQAVAQEVRGPEAPAPTRPGEQALAAGQIAPEGLTPPAPTPTQLDQWAEQAIQSLGRRMKEAIPRILDYMEQQLAKGTINSGYLRPTFENAPVEALKGLGDLLDQEGYQATKDSVVVRALRNAVQRIEGAAARPAPPAPAPAPTTAIPQPEATVTPVKAAFNELREAWNEGTTLGFMADPGRMARIQLRIYRALFNVARQLIAQGVRTFTDFLARSGERDSPASRDAFERALAGQTEPTDTPQLSRDVLDDLASQIQPIQPGSRRAESVSKIGKYEYVTQQESERQDYANRFIDVFHEGNLFEAAGNLGEIQDDAFRQVTAAELTRRAAAQFRAANRADRIILTGLIQRLWAEVQGGKNMAGQWLQSNKQVNQLLFPQQAVLAYLNLIRERQTDVIGPQVPGDAAQQITSGLNKAGEEAAAALNPNEPQGILKRLLNFFQRQEAGVGRRARPGPTKAQSEAVLERINAMFPLANWREIFTEKGSQGIANRFFQLLADARERPGHVWTFESIVRSELGKLLVQAIRKAGIAPTTPLEGPTTAQRIAQFLGDDPLRSDKLKLIDQAVSEDIASRPEGPERDQLQELWDRTIGLLSSAPAAETTAARLVQEVIKDNKINWNAIYESNNPDAALAAARDVIVNEAGRRVQKAATARLDLDPLREVVGAAFDKIADTRRQRFEGNLIAKRAREAIAETMRPERQAQSIINQWKRRALDFQKITKPNEVAAVLQSFLEEDITAGELLTSLQDLGLTPTTADNVLAAAQQELEIRKLHDWSRERDKMAKVLASDKVIDRLLAKARVALDIDWSELFQALPSATHAERQRALFERINADPRFANLTTTERAELEQALFKAWDRARMSIFRQEFARLVEMPRVTPQVRERIKDSIPALVRYSNLGLLDQPAFLNAVAEKFGLGSVNDQTINKLLELSDKAVAAPEGSVRNKIYEQMLYLLTNAKTIKPYSLALARDFWYANVLSGLRTHINIGTGNFLTGFAQSAIGAADLLIVGQGPAAPGQEPPSRSRNAARVMSAFFSAIGDGSEGFVHILRTGDTSKLPDAQDRLADQLSEIGKVNTLETLLRQGTGWQKIVGQFAYVSRLIQGLDYLFAIGARRSMQIYASAKRGDWDSMAAAMKVYDQEARTLARNEAMAEFQRLGMRPTSTDLRARTDEILEAGINQEIRDNATHLARVANLSVDPIGFGGFIYKALNKGFFIRAVLGQAFLRSAINMAQQQVNWLPGLGLANYYRTKANEWDWFKALPKDHPFRSMALDVPPEQRSMILGAQLIGLGLTSTAMTLWLTGDDEDRDSEISGTWTALSPAEKRQLLARGERPLAIRMGSTWISYANTPFATALAWVGTLRDRQRFKNEKWEADSLLGNLANGWLFGLAYIKDISSLTKFSQMLGISSYNRGEIDYSSATKWMADTLGSFAGGLVPAKSMLSDIDAWTDPSLYRADAGFDFWLRQLPFARRFAGYGPAVNMLGEEIQVSRAPLSRWLSPEKRNPIWDAVSEKASRGVFIPVPAKNATIVDRTSGKRRQLTGEEFYHYTQRAGNLWRQTIERNLDAFRRMTPQQAEAWIDRMRPRVHQQARIGLQLARAED